MTRAIMIQGAGSNVGKSVVVAGLARAFARRGLRVAPFKPQNMSNNAAVTEDGGEIGRAQALQALAAGRAPHTDMNPVLLKPETETGAQVVVHGKRLATVRARDYSQLKPSLMPPVLESFHRLAQTADLVLVEGAGSPAEVNLRRGDIANMGFAQAADIPVIIIGDIDRGGVIAQLVGTHQVVDKADVEKIKGFIINKFRGDMTLFDDGYKVISTETGWQGLGILPWFADAADLPAEDALDIGSSAGSGDLHIACLVLSRIANFDDLDPLRQEPGVRLSMIGRGQAIPGDVDLVIIPGSKSTRGDLEYLRAQGWDIDLAAHVRRGGAVLGICGGYQMLGRVISDPEGIEGPAGEMPGLGLLDVATRMSPQKHLTRVSARHHATGKTTHGYEIHIGETTGADCALPFADIAGRGDGATSADGRIMGTYLHGLFGGDDFRAAFLKRLGGSAGNIRFAARTEAVLDALADHIETHLDVDGILNMAGEVRT